MADVIGGELQTLISTLQNGNVQLGQIYRALGGTRTALDSLSSQMGAVAHAAIGSQLGATAPATPLPASPDGYITIEIPGVGPRLIPYYPV